MDEKEKSEFTQCPHCKHTFAGVADFCPSCGMKFGTGYSPTGVGCFSGLVGCGCVLLIAFVLLSILIPVLLWLSPIIIIILLILLLMKKG